MAKVFKSNPFADMQGGLLRAVAADPINKRRVKPTRKAKKIKASRTVMPQPSKMMHLIHIDGSVESSEWNGKLEDGHPPLSDLAFLIGADYVEPVTVLYRGKRAYMFVDDTGKLRHAPFNWKASALYVNWSLFNDGATNYLFQDLTHEPTIPAATLLKSDFAIAGAAIMWEGTVK